MKKTISFLFSFAFLPQFLLSLSLVFEEKLGDKVFPTIYQITEDKTKHLVQSENGSEKYSMIFSSTYQLEKLTFLSKENSDHYELALDQHLLLVEGVIDGKSQKKSFDLHGRPWVQNLPFGLISFATSPQTSLNFYVVRLKDLVLYQMKAKKTKIETLTLRNKSYKAQKIEVHLAGFKGLFWKAELWFDLDSHFMIYYRSNEGPHTPTNTLELIENHPTP